ncbi:sec-independent protein translocase protein TatB-like [Melopsittacus undulatus]|uniref:sec-independent protein translocase protein TatB-like n=1 Tax=Melopsittacus undulatus TaxID=13146 RepID=UPI00146AECCF|nr:sec-independent protein translocase protein TatB-like [Melopsittacus undulatus]
MELDELRKMKDTVEGRGARRRAIHHTSAANFEKDWKRVHGIAQRHVFLVRLLFLRLRQRYVQRRGAGLRHPAKTGASSVPPCPSGTRPAPGVRTKRSRRGARVARFRPQKSR